MIDLVNEYIKNHNIIITSSPNNGMTSLSLCIANILSSEGKTILYYNPTRDIDREFIRKYYSHVFNNVVMCGIVQEQFIEFCTQPGLSFDYIFVDPADPMVGCGNTIPQLIKLGLGKIICTSQIRLDPNKGWKTYSTVEKKFMNYFNYSLWLRKVSEESLIYDTKYVDVFKEERNGNNFIARYTLSMSKKNGNIIT